MTQQAQDTVATGTDPAYIARAVYLAAVRRFLEKRDQDSRDATLTAYAACQQDGSVLHADVRAKISRMLGDLVRRDMNAWAKFLSIHVGFTDVNALATFKDISPFNGWSIVEQDAFADASQTIALRGDSKDYLALMHGDDKKEFLTIPISTHVERGKAFGNDGRRVTRTLIAVRPARTHH